MWGCNRHWFMLPRELRAKIWATYVPGQEVTKQPSAEYLSAAREVRAWIADYITKSVAEREVVQSRLNGRNLKKVVLDDIGTPHLKED